MDYYGFFFGDLFLGLIWLLGFLWRKDLRKAMIWSGLFYAALLAVFLIFFRLGTIVFPVASSREIVPGYWHPHTIFNLGRITGGYSVEDGLYMFFVGGIATYVYELIFHKSIRFKRKIQNHIHAVKLAAFAAALLALLTNLNLMYSLILFGYVGAAVIWRERKDLIAHSVVGGVCFALIYIVSFMIFNLLFPHFVGEFYTFKNVSGVLILGIPLEEYLYALSFGLMWAPFYEYEHGEKDIAFQPKTI